MFAGPEHLAAEFTRIAEEERSNALSRRAGNTHHGGVAHPAGTVRTEHLALTTDVTVLFVFACQHDFSMPSRWNLRGPEVTHVKTMQL